MARSSENVVYIHTEQNYSKSEAAQPATFSPVSGRFWVRVGVIGVG